jgi:hypothetical protein
VNLSSCKLPEAMEISAALFGWISDAFGRLVPICCYVPLYCEVLLDYNI